MPAAREDLVLLRELGLGFRGDLDLRAADVLDLDGRRAVHLTLVVAERELALHVVLVLRERAVLDPELRGAFAAADVGALRLPAAPSAEAHERFDALFGQLAGVGVSLDPKST